MDDQQLGLLLKVAILVALAAFWPQIRKFLHRIGYRDWRDRNK